MRAGPRGAEDTCILRRRSYVLSMALQPSGSAMHAAAALEDIPAPVWIVLMIAGFVAWWPVGLAILAYVVWSGKMHRWKHERWARRMRQGGCRHGHWHRSSGNSAFDAYREETLKRLEDEQDAFAAFVERLRRAKDQAEFDAFMAERRPQANPSA